MNIEQRIEFGRSTLHRVWSSLIAPGTACALIGYPDHWNVGDTAIWRSTRLLLDQLGVHVAYACDAWSYDPRRLERRLPDGPLLICGGGNFGDVYPNEITLRQRVLIDFPYRRIIQLPQSIWFRDPAHLASMAALLAQQRDFTLLTRDRHSLTLARDHFPVPSLLCPDTAMAMAQPEVHTAPLYPVLALWRDDAETDTPTLCTPPDWHVQDWTWPAKDHRLLSLPVQALRWAAGPTPYDRHDGIPSLRRICAWRAAPDLWEALAEQRVLRGCQILRRGRVVITNRLHAHLLCVLMRIPHVVCDTLNGKISAYRNTWPIEDPRVRWATSPEDAVNQAHDLLETG